MDTKISTNQIISELSISIQKLQKEIDDLRKSKDQAYYERNQLVVVLSKLFPSHLCRHPAEDPTWERDWMNIVCIHLPTGQATWHIHDSELTYFNHLSFDTNHWDGHSTEEKYKRLAKIISAYPKASNDTTMTYTNSITNGSTYYTKY